jgi:hypothetical protein
MKDKYILVKSNGEEEKFDKIKDVAKKYNYTAQHIQNILKGRTGKKYFVHDEKIIYVSFVNICEEEKLIIEKNRKKVYRKRAYEKSKIAKLDETIESKKVEND